MMGIFQIMFLYGIVKFLDASEHVLGAAIFYAVGTGLLALIFGGIERAITVALISLVVGLVYFYLLHYFKDSSMYWIVLVLGFLVFFI